MMEVWLKITGTDDQLRKAFEIMGLDGEMLRENEDGTLNLTVFNHDVAMLHVPNLTTKYTTYDKADPLNAITPAVFAGPHLMIRFVSASSQEKALNKIGKKPTLHDLPDGLEHADAPITMAWAA